MVTPIGANLYNVSSSIQSNSMLNRAVMETGGVEIPFILMANNKDERIERLFRNSFYVATSFVAPVLAMPFLNKFFLKRAKLIENKKEADILCVSKGFLTKDVKEMEKGFQITAEELKSSDKKKFKDVSKHFNNVLERFPDKEVLRQKLIKTHNRVFWSDFLITSALAVSVPWISNLFTERRTKRAGYVGEFEIADKKYTDKMTEKHERNKKIKLGLSCLPSILTAASFYKVISNSMIKPEEKLGKFGKLIKRNMHKFDYKNAIFMSKAGYFAVMLVGEMPVHFLASRDKHELKMRVTAWAVIMSMLFGGDFVLNNLVGRTCDAKFGTTLMNKKGFEKAGFFKKFLMDTHSLDKLNKMTNVSKKTKRAALFMYCGNFALTTALLGFGVNAATNKNMKKDVKKDLEK